MTHNKQRKMDPPPPRILRAKFILTTALILTLAFALASCGDSKKDPTYTVYAASSDADTFNTEFEDIDIDGIPLEDDMYIWLTFDDEAVFNEMISGFTNDERHEWTKDDIYNYLRTGGLAAPIANTETTRIISNKHAFFASRVDDTVYVLIK